MIDLDEYRQQSHDVWERVAPNWGGDARGYLTGVMGPVGERLVERLDPQPGQTILELAAGTGETGFSVAERVGNDGRLISTDFSAAMIEEARAEGERRGVENVEYRELDAERMDLEDSSVDGVVCRFGYMLMADPAAALSETRRVLRDEGRLAFAVWASPEANPWAALPGKTMMELELIPAPEPGAPGIFALQDPERIKELVTGAGFGESDVEEVPVKWPFDDADGYWHFLNELAGPVALTIRGLDEGARDRLSEVVRERVEPLLAETDELPGLTLVVTAT